MLSCYLSGKTLVHMNFNILGSLVLILFTWKIHIDVLWLRNGLVSLYCLIYDDKPIIDTSFTILVKNIGFFCLSEICLHEKIFFVNIVLLHLQFSLFMSFFCYHLSKVSLYCILYLRYWAVNVNTRRFFLYFERIIELAKFGLQDQYVHSWLGL